MDGDRRGLGDRLAARVEERGGGVEALLHDRRRRALEERQLHLVGDGVEPVAQYLEEDRGRWSSASLREAQVAGVVDQGGHAGRDHGGRVVLLDDGGAGQARASGRRARS